MDGTGPDLGSNEEGQLQAPTAADKVRANPLLRDARYTAEWIISECVVIRTVAF